MESEPRQKSSKLLLSASFCILATVLAAGSVVSAEPTPYVVNEFPDDAPCEVFRRDAKGLWHLRKDVVMRAKKSGTLTGDFLITIWTTTAGSPDGQLLEKRCADKVK